MKKLVGIVLVLCVIAPSSFGIALAEYTWTGTTGNMTDSTWTVVVAGVTQPAGTYPAAPFESANTTAYTAYSRPQITGGTAVITVNTDLAPNDVGFQQVQFDKGSLTIGAGGRLVIGGGYMTAGAKNTAAGGGLFVQDGGIYINRATSGTQNGTLLTYTTASGVGAVTISGASTFQSTLMYAGRPGQTQVRTGIINVLGSGSTINVGTYGPGGNNTKAIFNFTADGSNAVSAINIATALAFNQGVTASHTANTSVLNFALGAAPTEGQVFTLFDLADGIAKSTGSLTTWYGSTLVEGGVMDVWFGDVMYGLKMSYVGGTSGNDVTLTTVPEPATLALLSLGGLVLARRRRA